VTLDQKFQRPEPAGGSFRATIFFRAGIDDKTVIPQGTPVEGLVVMHVRPAILMGTAATLQSCAGSMH